MDASTYNTTERANFCPEILAVQRVEGQLAKKNSKKINWHVNDCYTTWLLHSTLYMTRTDSHYTYVFYTHLRTAVNSYYGYFEYFE